MIHPNTWKSYQKCKLSGVHTKMVWLIASFFESSAPAAFTDREIKDVLGWRDMNEVRPKITNLIKNGFLEDIDRVHDTMTDRMVRRVRWAPQAVGFPSDQPQQASFPFARET